MNEQSMNRRAWIKTAGVGVGMTAAGCGAVETVKREAVALPQYANDAFYKDGEFDLETAKDAYTALLKYHGYPTWDGIRDQFWITDYGAGEFTKLGLGAIILHNRKEEQHGDRYMMLDIFLLPNQMLPEHYHLETPDSRAKLEAWIVRHGSATIVGEGEETPGLKERIPASQEGHVTVWHGVDCGPGGKAELNRVTARHWQLAGPEGAVVTEVANYHDGGGVRHTNPNLVL